MASKDATNKQKYVLQKLMNNFDKPVIIPPPSEEPQLPKPPEFVRNIMGSSAGAGSAEFHLYRKLRRRDMVREGIYQEQLAQEEKAKVFKDKIEMFKQQNEAKRKRKRAKRLKLKTKLKTKKEIARAGENLDGMNGKSTSMETDNKANPSSEEDLENENVLKSLDLQHKIKTPYQ